MSPGVSGSAGGLWAWGAWRPPRPRLLTVCSLSCRRRCQATGRSLLMPSRVRPGLRTACLCAVLTCVWRMAQGSPRGLGRRPQPGAHLSLGRDLGAAPAPTRAPRSRNALPSGPSAGPRTRVPVGRPWRLSAGPPPACRRQPQLTRPPAPVLVTLPAPCLVGGCGDPSPSGADGQSCGVAGMAGWGSVRPREAQAGPHGRCTRAETVGPGPKWGLGCRGVRPPQGLCCWAQLALAS